jgi:hypothetical protein
MSQVPISKARTVGILSNPLSGSEFEKVLDEFGRNEIEVLVIIAGDGTVHALLTYIFNNPVFSRMPDFAIIPAGTTNMTAKDFKFSGKPEKVLGRLTDILLHDLPYPCMTKSVLCIKNGNAKPQYGMFFGTGLVAEGVSYFQQRVRKLGITGEKASGIVLLRYFIALLLGRSGDKLTGSTIDINKSEDTDYLLVFATCLDRLLLGMRPYWGREEEAIHVTLIKKAPRALWKSILPVLGGKGEGLREENGYSSHNFSDLSLAITGDYVIDGEIYALNKDNGLVNISAKNSITIIELSN